MPSSAKQWKWMEKLFGPSTHLPHACGVPLVRSGHSTSRMARHESNGAPSMIRTCDLLVRSQTLYPAELWARQTFDLNIGALPTRIALRTGIKGHEPKLVALCASWEESPSKSRLFQRLPTLNADVDDELTAIVGEVIVVHTEIQNAADGRGDLVLVADRDR